MKNKIESDFGFPFYAVIPLRDFCYIFSENDLPSFQKELAKVVVMNVSNQAT
jgi:hypothetical protein